MGAAAAPRLYFRVCVERIIVSKRAAGRTKDVAVLPALEEALAAIRGKHAS